jgi:polyphenol oxidase
MIRNFMVDLHYGNTNEDKRTLSAFNDPRCSHAFFDRHGGVGRSPFSTRNVSFGVGDEASIVRKNRGLVKKSLQLDRLIPARQVHGDAIYRYSGDLPIGDEVAGVDALITDHPGAGLMIQQADCQAVLLFDPVRPAIGAIHCGWRSLTGGIVEHALNLMNNQFGTLPELVLAATGPGAGVCCYEVGPEVAEKLHPASVVFRNGKAYADLKAEIAVRLRESGVPDRNIEIHPDCTICNNRYFSHRRDKGITGRMMGFVVLK